MIIFHDHRPCTSNGHSAYRGYDAIVGKAQSLGLRVRQQGQAHPCQHCSAWFGTADNLSDHMRRKHGVAA